MLESTFYNCSHCDDYNKFTWWCSSSIKVQSSIFVLESSSTTVTGVFRLSFLLGGFKVLLEPSTISLDQIKQEQEDQLIWGLIKSINLTTIKMWQNLNNFWLEWQTKCHNLELEILNNFWNFLEFWLSAFLKISTRPSAMLTQFQPSPFTIWHFARTAS